MKNNYLVCVIGTLSTLLIFTAQEEKQLEPVQGICGLLQPEANTKLSAKAWSNLLYTKQINIHALSLLARQQGLIVLPEFHNQCSSAKLLKLIKAERQAAKELNIPFKNNAMEWKAAAHTGNEVLDADSDICQGSGCFCDLCCWGKLGCCLPELIACCCITVTRGCCYKPSAAQKKTLKEILVMERDNDQSSEQLIVASQEQELHKFNSKRYKELLTNRSHMPEYHPCLTCCGCCGLCPIP
jgi:hypothetical protein